MEGPFFSIITVSYNAGELLQKTADLLRAQTCRDYEHIIKDACSTDGSLDALSADEQTRVISKPDDGIYDGMNQAIAEAKGDYIYFFNCGDSFADENVLADIKSAITAAESENGAPEAADIVYGNYIHDGIVNIQPKHLAVEYLYRRPLNHQSMFISRNVFGAVGGFDTSLKIRADHEHTLRALKNGIRFLHVPRNVCVYEGGGYSEKPENRQMRIDELEAIRSKYYTDAERKRLDKKQSGIIKGAKKIVFSKRMPRFMRRLYTKFANIINK